MCPRREMALRSADFLHLLVPTSVLFANKLLKHLLVKKISSAFSSHSRLIQAQPGGFSASRPQLAHHVTASAGSWAGLPGCSSTSFIAVRKSPPSGHSPMDSQTAAADPGHSAWQLGFRSEKCKRTSPQNANTYGSHKVKPRLTAGGKQSMDAGAEAPSGHCVSSAPLANSLPLHLCECEPVQKAAVVIARILLIRHNKNL